MAQKNVVLGIDKNMAMDDPKCSFSIFGKMTRREIRKQAEGQASGILDCVHKDVFGKPTIEFIGAQYISLPSKISTPDTVGYTH